MGLCLLANLKLENVMLYVLFPPVIRIENIYIHMVLCGVLLTPFRMEGRAERCSLFLRSPAQWVSCDWLTCGRMGAGLCITFALFGQALQRCVLRLLWHVSVLFTFCLLFSCISKDLKTAENSLNILIDRYSCKMWIIPLCVCTLFAWSIFYNSCLCPLPYHLIVALIHACINQNSVKKIGTTKRAFNTGNRICLLDRRM